MPKRQQPKLNLSADQVWAAACAAYRINGGYLKAPEVTADVVRPCNRELVRLYLADDSNQFITDADRRQGLLCRQTLKNSVTLSALKGELSEWNLLVARMTALDVITTDYEVSVITAMPKSHAQTLARETVDTRLVYCEADPIGAINEALTLQGEVVRCNYSAKWNTFYATVITDTNHQVFFAYRERLEPGSVINFRGRVKRHADRATQLSRVKLLNREAV
jgi:hypothetical protein